VLAELLAGAPVRFIDRVNACVRILVLSPFLVGRAITPIAAAQLREPETFLDDCPKVAPTERQRHDAVRTCCPSPAANGSLRVPSRQGNDRGRDLRTQFADEIESLLDTMLRRHVAGGKDDVVDGQNEQIIASVTHVRHNLLGMDGIVDDDLAIAIDGVHHNTRHDGGRQVVPSEQHAHGSACGIAVRLSVVGAAHA